MGWFDVHAHVTHPKLAPRQDEILANAEAAGVTTILANGLNPQDNEADARVAAAHPIVKPCFGFYPVDTVLQDMEAMGVDYPRDVPPVSAEEGVAWVRDHVEDAFAVGEIGLDGYWVPEALWEKQEDVFRRLVAIAMEADKANFGEALVSEIPLDTIADARLILTDELIREALSRAKKDKRTSASDGPISPGDELDLED